DEIALVRIRKFDRKVTARAFYIPLSRSSTRGLSGPRLSKVLRKFHTQLSPWIYRPIGRTPCRVASAPVRRSGPAPRGHDDRESSETRPQPPDNGARPRKPRLAHRPNANRQDKSESSHH